MRSLALLFLSGLMLLSASPASADTEIEATLTLSDPRPEAHDVVYSWDLEIKAPLSSDSLRVSVPAGTSGEPRLYLLDGLPAGDLQFDGHHLIFRFRQKEFLAGQRIIFAVGGLSNAGSEGGFAGSVVFGHRAVQTAEVLLDRHAGTIAMVFVTSQAAHLTKEDPGPLSRTSVPVLMTNEQQYDLGNFQSSSSVPSPTALGGALLASLLLVGRKRVLSII